MTTIATSLERCTLITMHERAPHTVPRVPQADPLRDGRVQTGEAPGAVGARQAVGSRDGFEGTGGLARLAAVGVHGSTCGRPQNGHREVNGAVGTAILSGNRL